MILGRLDFQLPTSTKSPTPEKTTHAYDHIKLSILVDSIRTIAVKPDLFSAPLFAPNQTSPTSIIIEPKLNRF